MKTTLPLKPPVHASYRRHRAQMWWQIVFPVLMGALVLVALPVVVWLAGMRGGGDLPRWAAISTIWILLSPLFGLLLLFVLLAAAIYLTTRLTRVIPPYSLRVQQIAHGAAQGTQRAGEVVRRPVLALRGLGDSVKSAVRRLREGV